MDFNLKIGVSLGGSLGDVLNASALLVGLKRQFPQSEITFFLFKGAEVLKGNKLVNYIKVLDYRNFNQLTQRYHKDFDIFVDIRYPVKYFFSGNALKHTEVLEFKQHWESIYKLYYEKMWEQFLGNIKLVNEFCDRNSMNIYELRRDSACLEYTEDDQFIGIEEVDFKASEKYDGLRIVTVNNSGVAGTMTKSWSTYGWAQVIKHLRDRGFYVIQLGTPKEESITGSLSPAPHDRFYGTIQETAALMKRAKFNILIEGGLSHVAKAVNKKSIVLFGPTPIYVFGYQENINLRGPECSPCWHPRGAKFDWNKVCAKTHNPALQETPPCMKSLDWRLVNGQIDKLMVELGMATKKGLKNA